MNTYNKVMQKVWLALTVLIVIAVTYLGIRDGFERWYFYYIFAGLTLGLYFLRGYMMRHMEKHQEFLKRKEEEERRK